MIRTQSGKCICPKGTELKNGACRKVEQPPARQCKLLPGQIRTENGRCVCPRGTKLASGQCRKTTVECPQGTRLKNGTCVPVVVVDPKGCPVGTVGKYPNCRKPPRVRPGLTLKPNRIDPGPDPEALQQASQSGGDAHQASQSGGDAPSRQSGRDAPHQASQSGCDAPHQADRSGRQATDHPEQTNDQEVI